MKRYTGVLIGAMVEVEGSNLRGKLINETKHTITIKTAAGEKKLLKEQHAFIINNARVDGEQLRGRPEERIKNR
jgi:RNase P/RNase MRP subunit p29